MAEFVKDDAGEDKRNEEARCRAPAGSPPFSQALTPIHARRRKNGDDELARSLRRKWPMVRDQDMRHLPARFRIENYAFWAASARSAPKFIAGPASVCWHCSAKLTYWVLVQILTVEVRRREPHSKFRAQFCL